MQNHLKEINSLKALKKEYEKSLPIHLGLILDGNRRWIKKQGINDVSKGHMAGYQTLRNILMPIFDAGIHYLTVYALSSENVLKRSDKEVEFLFSLLIRGISEVLKEPLIHDNKVKVRLIGRLQNLPEKIQQKIEKMHKITENYSENFINICILYDGQEEIVDAIKNIVNKGIDISKINKETVKENLYTSKFPELDYIIRTGMDDGARISGFLLWDASYAEFKFRNELWPDYTEKMLLEDLKDYILRNRRKGK